MPPIGKRRWAIAEGYVPEGSTGPAPQMTSHETACILRRAPGNAASGVLGAIQVKIAS